MTPQNVASLTIRLGDHNIKQGGEKVYESRVSRVVRHKGFSDETLVQKLPPSSRFFRF